MSTRGSKLSELKMNTITNLFKQDNVMKKSFPSVALTTSKKANIFKKQMDSTSSSDDESPNKKKRLPKTSGNSAESGKPCSFDEDMMSSMDELNKFTIKRAKKPNAELGRIDQKQMQMANDKSEKPKHEFAAAVKAIAQKQSTITKIVKKPIVIQDLSDSSNSSTSSSSSSSSNAGRVSCFSSKKMPEVEVVEPEESNLDKLKRVQNYLLKKKQIDNLANEFQKATTATIDCSVKKDDSLDALSFRPIMQNYSKADNKSQDCVKLSDNTYDEDDDDDLVVTEVKKKPVKEFNYKLVKFNEELEKKIEKIKYLNELTTEQIEYMVLYDVNYFINIFAGQCEHSWRHLEYKKLTHSSSKVLYSNSAICSYTEEQYMCAVKALQKIFAKTSNKYDDYIVKVLLPEALLKICMKVYQCTKLNAEEYLFHNNCNNPIEFYRI